MNCPSCGTKDAYQGFNYRDGQVDCVYRRCVQYSEKHAKAVAGAVDLEDTQPGYKARAKTPAGKLTEFEDPSTFIDDEDLEKLWDSRFKKTVRFELTTIYPNIHYQLDTRSPVALVSVAPDLGIMRPLLSVDCRAWPTVDVMSRDLSGISRWMGHFNRPMTFPTYTVVGVRYCGPLTGAVTVRFCV